MSRLSWIPKEPRLRHRPVEPRRRSRGPAISRHYDRIDSDTRLLVWARDNGRCRNCGSAQDLQFDHIIPKSRGGSNTAENVELLCRRCNLRKSASLYPPRLCQTACDIKEA